MPTLRQIIDSEDMEITAGGQGSGCNPNAGKCGRKSGQHEEGYSSIPKTITHGLKRAHALRNFSPHLSKLAKDEFRKARGHFREGEHKKALASMAKAKDFLERAGSKEVDITKDAGKYSSLFRDYFGMPSRSGSDKAKIKSHIEKLQRSSIGNSDPEERAKISRRLDNLDKHLR